MAWRRKIFSARATNDAPDLSPQEFSSDDTDENEEEAIDFENQKAFFHWELRLSSRSTGIQDFFTGDPAVGDIGRRKVLAELQFYEKRLGARQDGPPGCSDDSTNENALETIRGYARHVKQHGEYPEGFRRALPPFSLAEYRAGVDRITGINQTSELSRLQEDTAAANEDFIQRFSSPSAGMKKISKHDSLYSLLVARSECGNSIHRAILPCRGNDIDEYQVDLILSVCKNATTVNDWLETRLTYESLERRISSSHNPGQIDLCSEIRRFSAHKCPLPLSFDGVKQSHRPRPQEMNKAPLQTPMKLTLDELLRGGTFEEENLEIRLKKSRLALQLALLLQRLYPGPWIQQSWTTQTIQTLGSLSHKDHDAPDLSRVGIPCDLSTELEVTNTAWREFNDAQDPRKTTFCRFFLSFAQLLVDICDGCPTRRLASVEDEETWYDELLEKAFQLQNNKLLQWYGRAVEGCAKFALDYHTSHENVDNPRDRAQKVIQENIVRNLHKNKRLWDDEWDRHLEAFSSESIDVHVAQTSPSDRSQGQESNAAPTITTIIPDQRSTPGKFFNLFSGIDKSSTQRRPGETEDNDFIKLMRRFTDSYLPPLPRSTERPIRIAVLDTGLLISEDDTLLLASSKRVLSNLSRSYVGVKDQQQGNSHYVDVDGHGTHVVRLLLDLTRRAEVVMIKISTGPTLEHSQITLQQVINALEYAGAVGGADADIINLSFGLDEAAKEEMSSVIERLVGRGKLIFASASNSGGNGRRAYPAKDTGVFAIHATNFEGASPDGLNPPCVSAESGDNFATFGCKVPSHWNGTDVYITGTSFATPVAAAIAANVLDFVRRASKIQIYNPKYFFTFGAMRRVFLRLSSRMGNYDYIRPWNEGMFDGDLTIEQMYWRLQQMSVIHVDRELDRVWLKNRAIGCGLEARIKEWAGNV